MKKESPPVVAGKTAHSHEVAHSDFSACELMTKTKSRRQSPRTSTEQKETAAYLITCIRNRSGRNCGEKGPLSFNVEAPRQYRGRYGRTHKPVLQRSRRANNTSSCAQVVYGQARGNARLHANGAEGQDPPGQHLGSLPERDRLERSRRDRAGSVHGR